MTASEEVTKRDLKVTLEKQLGGNSKQLNVTLEQQLGGNYNIIKCYLRKITASEEVTATMTRPVD